MAELAQTPADEPRVLYHHRAHRLKIVVTRTTHPVLCLEAMAVYERSLGRPAPVEQLDSALRPCDLYSHLLCLYAGDTMIGTCSVTFSKEGAIDTPEVYPRILFDRFGNDIFSLYRMGIWREHSASLSRLQQHAFFARYLMPLMRTAFVYGIENGGRLMLSLATEKTVATFCAITCERLPTQRVIYHPAQPETPVYPIYAVVDPSLSSIRKFTRGLTIERPLTIARFNEVLRHRSLAGSLNEKRTL